MDSAMIFHFLFKKELLQNEIDFLKFSIWGNAELYLSISSKGQNIMAESFVSAWFIYFSTYFSHIYIYIYFRKFFYDTIILLYSKIN